MSKIRLKQIDQNEVSGYILDVTTGTFSGINSSLTGCIYTGATLSGGCTILANQFNTYSGQLVTFSGELDTIEQDFTDFDANLGNVSGEVYAISGYMNSLSGDMVFFSGLVGTLQSTVTSLSSNVLAISGSLNTVSGNLDTLSGNLNTVSGIASTATGNISAFSGTYTTATGNLNAAITGLSGSFTGFTGRYVNDYIYLCDVSGSGVAGGTFNSGSWVTRNINTEVIDSGNLCSLSANRMTLSGGVYRCDISVPAYLVSTHISRLRNISNSTTLLTGTAEYSSVGVQSRSRILGQFTITGTTGQLLEVQHICGASSATFGLGAAGSVADNVPNIYTTAEFTRIRT